VLLDQGFIAMEGDRVKVQVEGTTAGQTELAHGIFDPEGPRAPVELSDVGDISRGRPRPGWALVVSSARQPRESFVPENLCDGDRAERMPLVGQATADVINREVLLAQGDDTFPEGIGLGCGMGPLSRGEEEVSLRIPAELVDEDSEAPRSVTEASSDLGTGYPINEEGAESLVLAVDGVGGFKEDLRKVR
jgi:hypothetical protein